MSALNHMFASTSLHHTLGRVSSSNTHGCHVLEAAHHQALSATQAIRRSHSFAGAIMRRQRLSCHASSSSSSDSFETRQSGQHVDDINAEWQNFIRPRHGAPKYVSQDRTRSSRPTHGTQSYQSYDDWDFHDDEICVPYPSNTPVNETYDRSLELWTLAAERAYHDRPSVDMFHGKAYWSELKEVYVILFGVGEKETEGIYSLRALSEEGLPQETIIAFENEEGAERYAGLLEATMEHVPNVCSIPPQELLQFCIDAGYSCRLEQQGSLLIPPDFNVGVTDWERSLRLREGHWSVLENEPVDKDPSVPAMARHPRTVRTADLPAARPHPPSLWPLPGNAMRHSIELSEEELDCIRARLESLLPSDSVSDSE